MRWQDLVLAMPVFLMRWIPPSLAVKKTIPLFSGKTAQVIPNRLLYNRLLHNQLLHNRLLHSRLPGAKIGFLLYGLFKTMTAPFISRINITKLGSLPDIALRSRRIS